MKEFVKVPASKQSLSNRRLVYGVGVNDVDYMIHNDGVKCPVYSVWLEMIRRCYSDSWHAKRPSYIGCTVCGDWLYLSKFSSWMLSKDFRGKQLDKDLKVLGNKLYSPETCLFISGGLNKFLGDHSSARGDYHVGVDLCGGRFRAQISYLGRFQHIGYYQSESEAAVAYLNKKADIADFLSNTETGEVKDSLLRFADITREKANHIHKTITKN